MNSRHFGDLVREINNATFGSSGASITELFHDDVVFVAPDFHTRLIGKQACLGSYAEFRALATIQEYELDDVQVDVCSDTAVVTYAFRVRYTLDGKPNDDSGRDLLVFQRTMDDQWLVVWRTMVEQHQ